MLLEFMSLALTRIEGSLFATDLSQLPSKSSWFLRLLPRSSRGEHTTVSGPLHSVVATASTTFGTASYVRAVTQRLSAQCKELVSTALYRGSYNPYVRSRALSWLPPLRLGLHYCGTPSTWPGVVYDRLHYDSPSAAGQYANRARPLWLPGVASVPFDPREGPESVEEPVPRRTDWWMDTLPQWAKYRVLKKKAEFQ